MQGRAAAGRRMIMDNENVPRKAMEDIANEPAAPARPCRQVDTTTVIVVRRPDIEKEIKCARGSRCCGTRRRLGGEARAGSPDHGQLTGSVLGEALRRRRARPRAALCTKTGAGHDRGQRRPVDQKGPKPLPASD